MMKVSQGPSFMAFLAIAVCASLASSSAIATFATEPTAAPDEAAGSKPETTRNQLSSKQFESLVDDYFDSEFRFNPSWGTQEGFHQFDNLLGEYSTDSVTKRTAQLKKFESDFNGFDASKLSPAERIDREMIVNHIKSQLLTIDQLEEWKKDPDLYTRTVSDAAFSLIKRDFAPLSERLKSVIEREKKIPDFLAQGMKNLDAQKVPPVYLDIAFEQLPGIISFFEDSVPAAFTSVADPELKKLFAKENAAVVNALKEYDQFLKKKLKGKCKGTFPIGADAFKKKLAFEEMVEDSLPDLLKRGYDELHRLQKEFIDLAKEIDPKSTPTKVFVKIAAEHPKPTELIKSVKNVLEEIRTYCVEKKICTIPSEERVRVDETPPFARALSFASMDTPGSFEKKAKEAYYHVTIPEANWSAKRTEEHMRSFSNADLLNTSIHEAYPGHYTQFLWVRNGPSKTRKILGCNSNAEGWAHYCEQMMLDEGFHKGDRNLKMVQVHDALLRVCRYIVGIEMHTGKMTLPQGIKFFMKEGYQEEANADRETKRGTMDPTYLVYTLGKLEILKLRDDYKKLKGDKYSLCDFHDRFLGAGYPPLKIIRQELLSAKN